LRIFEATERRSSAPAPLKIASRTGERGAEFMAKSNAFGRLADDLQMMNSATALMKIAARPGRRPVAARFENKKNRLAESS
jgi:hypothetical protein